MENKRRTDTENLGVYAVAKLAGVSAVTVYRWAEEGLPHRYEMQGRRKVIRIDWADAAKWIAEHPAKR